MDPSAGRGYAGNLAGDAKRESHVESAFNRMERELAALTASCDAIEQRLSVVMVPPIPPQAEGINKNPREVVVPLAERIEDSAKTVETVARRLASVLQRIEL